MPTDNAFKSRALNTLDASEIRRGIAVGAFTCEAVVQDCLAHIEARESTVHAWVNFDAAHVLRQAREADRAASRGPLHGVPIGVKDVLDTFDFPTEMGSEIYRGHRPVADAAVVALARAAGAIILGKTVTCEFAGQTPRMTTNPHNPLYTPGGSSSGSAAAVADFMVPAAFGTQTGGSVLRPSSFCGVIGYKPSFNTFNRFGVKPAAESLDTIGLITRSLEDMVLLRAVLLGQTPREIPPLTKPPRVGLCRTYLWHKTQQETREAVEDAAKRLGQAGAVLSDITLPDAFGGLSEAHRRIDCYERAMTMAYEWNYHRNQISDGLRDRIQEGLDSSYADYIAGLRLAERCRAELDQVFGDADILLAPCANGEAPKGLSQTGDPSLQALWTLLYVPTLTLPTSTGPNGLPVGIQLVARRYGDEHLLAAARWALAKLGAAKT